MTSFVFQLLDLTIPLLVNVAFVTLLERKILGLSQLRRGPNKSSLWGLFQPFSDAIKLFAKEITYLRAANSATFILAPLAGLALAIWVWSVSPPQFTAGTSLNALLILTIMSAGVYPLFLSGWASNSKFAQLGSMRAIAQTIAYEISLSVTLFALLLVVATLTLSQETMSALHTLELTFPLAALWLISCVAETNRTPFDFAEGESELVSGFNVEYGGGLFAVIFMAEYAMILFFSALTPAILMPLSPGSGGAEIMTVLLASWWIWLRSTFPRHRYDKLLNLAWKSLLPLSLGLATFNAAIAAAF